MDSNEKESISTQGLPSQPQSMQYKKTIMLGKQIRFLEDHWVLEDPIGQPGTFGVAYICHEKGKPEQKYVVKRINKAKFYHLNPIDRDDIVRTLSNEIHTQKALKHPNICELIDVWEGRNYVDLIMEHLTGGELFDRIQENEDGFTEASAAKIAKQLLEAVAFMHSKNICHFDLKPDNILFANKSVDSPIKIIDFGMAKALPRLKKLKQTVGTAYYMAPEVLAGQYDRQADVWSIGIIIFCMLFGFPPHYVDSEEIMIGESEEDAIAKLVKKGFTPEVKEGYGPWFPEDVPVSDKAKDLLAKLLTFDVKDRPSAAEAANHPWIREETHAKQLPTTVFRSLTKFQKTNRFKLLVSRLFAQKLDPQRYAETIESFKKWDVDHDGKITLEEFRSGMRQTTKLTNFEIDRIFRELDQDDDRFITFDELIVSVAFDALVSVDERLANIFGELDKDGDGIIDVAELKDTITNLQKLEDINHDLGRAESIIDEIDANQDHKIDYQEFLRALHPTLNELEPSDMYRLKSRGFGSIDEQRFNKYVSETRKQQLIDGVINSDKLLKHLQSTAVGPTKSTSTTKTTNNDMTVPQFDAIPSRAPPRSMRNVLGVLKENNDSASELEISDYVVDPETKSGSNESIVIDNNENNNETDNPIDNVNDNSDKMQLISPKTPQSEKQAIVNGTDGGSESKPLKNSSKTPERGEKGSKDRNSDRDKNRSDNKKSGACSCCCLVM